MMIAAEAIESQANSPWAAIIYDALMAAGIRHMSYVPDAGHACLIELLQANGEVLCNLLTTEEEGVAIAAGAWAGGMRSVLLMQSSGVGNCVNTLSLIAACRLPFLAFVTMRGEWAEFNPWQVPMGLATPRALQIIGVQTIRVDCLDDLADAARSAASLAFDSDQAVAVLLSQRLLGRKQWVSDDEHLG